MPDEYPVGGGDEPDIGKFVQYVKSAKTIPYIPPPVGLGPSQEELIFNSATLNDILTRLRRVEEITAALLLAKGLVKDVTDEASQIKK